MKEKKVLSKFLSFLSFFLLSEKENEKEREKVLFVMNHELLIAHEMRGDIIHLEFHKQSAAAETHTHARTQTPTHTQHHTHTRTHRDTQTQTHTHTHKSH